MKITHNLYDFIKVADPQAVRELYPVSPSTMYKIRRAKNYREYVKLNRKYRQNYLLKKGSFASGSTFIPTTWTQPIGSTINWQVHPDSQETRLDRIIMLLESINSKISELIQSMEGGDN